MKPLNDYYGRTYWFLTLKRITNRFGIQPPTNRLFRHKQSIGAYIVLLIRKKCLFSGFFENAQDRSVERCSAVRSVLRIYGPFPPRSSGGLRHLIVFYLTASG